MKSSAASRARAAVAFAAVVAAAGCHTGGGVLSGAGGEGRIPTGGGGAGTSPTGGGGAAVIVGTGGASSTPTGFGGAGMIPQNCATVSQPAAKLPVDMMIVLDTAASMNDPIAGSCTTDCADATKWGAAVDAVNAAVNAPETDTHVNWGLSFISGSAEVCDTGGIAATVDASWQINGALASRTDGRSLRFGGTRPTRGAVDLASAYLSGRGYGNDRVILLITDGVPDCKPGVPDLRTDDTDGVVHSVSEALGVGIATYVVGLATAGGPADTALDQIAGAGNLRPSYVSASSSTELTAAISSVVAARTACAFVVPPPPTSDGSTSRDDIGVRTTDARLIPQDPVDGWTYTSNALTGIQLHGAACDAVRASGSGVFIYFRCRGGP